MTEPVPKRSELARPVLVFDGDCGFCRLWVERWREVTGDGVEYLAQQDPACGQRFPGLDAAALRESVHRVDGEGRVTRGAEAVLRTLADVRGWGWGVVARGWLASPLCLAVAETAYRVVARNRTFFSLGTRMLWGDSVLGPTWWGARESFLVGLAVIHVVAFLSLWVQVDGLMGSRGILPAAEYMAGATEQLDRAGVGWDRYRLLPTMVWWLGAGDTVLRGLCLAGVALAILAGIGYARAPAFLGLWLAYLSLSVVGQDFLSFQWDTLLLETTFLAVFLAPWCWGRAKARRVPPSGWARWLVVWLLFRLMFESGVVKWASGDATWRAWTALEYHFWTQPLPGPLAWHVDQWPSWAHRAACALVLGIECLVPWLVWGPRRLRLAAFLAFAALQVAIAGTGNYTFFNALALVLSLVLVDDATWRRVGSGLVRWRREKGKNGIRSEGAPGVAALGLGKGRGTRALPGETWRRGMLVIVVVVWVVVGGAPVLGPFVPGFEGPVPWLERWVGPFRTINRYGLFAVMTTSRPEIEVEGSLDGTHWRAYAFRYKPGALERRPVQVAPHQPRLDWQMWFAALGDVRQNPWFFQFGLRLMEGSPPVLGLLKENPFPEGPPRYIRARLYHYRFTTAEERRETRAWWVREERGLYCPPFGRREDVR